MDDIKNRENREKWNTSILPIVEKLCTPDISKTKITKEEFERYIFEFMTSMTIANDVFVSADKSETFYSIFFIFPLLLIYFL